MKHLKHFDKLAMEYKFSTCERRRNTIIKEILPMFRPKLESIKAKFENRYHDDLESNYAYFTLRALELWKGINANTGVGCSFKTYLYSWIGKKVAGEVVEKNIRKDRREIRMGDIDDNIGMY